MPAGLVPIETNQRRPPFAEPEHPDHDLGGHFIIRGKIGSRSMISCSGFR